MPGKIQGILPRVGEEGGAGLSRRKSPTVRKNKPDPNNQSQIYVLVCCTSFVLQCSARAHCDPLLLNRHPQREDNNN